MWYKRYCSFNSVIFIELYIIFLSLLKFALHLVSWKVYTYIFLKTMSNLFFYGAEFRWKDLIK